MEPMRRTYELGSAASEKNALRGQINGGHEWSHGVVLARNTAIFQDECILWQR